MAPLITTDQKFKELVDKIHASEMPEDTFTRSLEDLIYDWEKLSREQRVECLGNLELCMEVFRQGINGTREEVLINTIERYMKDLGPITEDDMLKIVNCAHCKGEGWQPTPSGPESCETCKGTGKVEFDPTKCPHCAGGGTIFVGSPMCNAVAQCIYCKGTGKVQ